MLVTHECSECVTGLFISRLYVFFFKQKTAYEMRISDWSSDVCSSDLRHIGDFGVGDEMIFDFLRIDVHSAGDDHEALAVGQIEEAIFINFAHIAQGRPALRVAARRRFLIIPMIFEEIGRESCGESVWQYV